MTAPIHRLRAFNTATASENKIHDDEVAKALGFSGGLVPGVDVYAYLTHPAVEEWGLGWLERGAMHARFQHPVYDGEEVEVVATPVDDDAGRGVAEIGLTVRGAAEGDERAEARAELPAVAPVPPDDVLAIPAGEAPAYEERPPATRATLERLHVLGAVEVGFHAGDEADAYLRDVREDLAVYRDQGVAHPAWLLRQANRVLAANVRLGPWIHVGSAVQHLGLVRDGDRVSVRARVAALYERKGHEFVDLDVVMLTDRPVVTVRHTAIYRPRGVDPVT